MAADAESDRDGWVLAIETSNPSSRAAGPLSSVAGAVVGPGGGLGEIAECWFEPGSRHEDGLLPAVEGVRAALGVEPGSLRRVCVSIGPGGYTGLRVATTAAMLLADSTGAELVGVPSASVVAQWAANERGVTQPFAVCLASKRGVAHATVFADPADPSAGREFGLIDEGGLAPLGVRVVFADRHFPSSIRLRANDLGIIVESPVLTASACLRVGVRLPPVSGGLVAPLYAREPEAVRLWASRSSRSDS